jgi:O-antigen/teichoic acid export membrane protein
MIYESLKKLGKHSAIYALGPAVHKLLGFALLPLVTAYIGSTANYGVTEIAGITLAVAGQLLGINLLYGMTRYYADYADPRDRARLVSTSMWLLIASTGGAFAVACVFRERGAELLFGSREYAGVLVATAAILFFQTIGQVGLRYLQILERSVTYGVLTTAKLLCEIGLKVWFLVGLGLTYMGVLYSVLGGEILIAVGLSLAIFGRIGLGFSPEMARRLWRYSAPLIISGLCMFVLHEADRYVIQRYRGADEVGVYAVCYKLGTISNAILLEGFGLIWFPFIFAMKDPEAVVLTCRKVLTYFTALACWLSLALALFSTEIVAVMADEQFAGAHRPMPLIVAGYVFWAIFQIVHTAFYLRERTGLVSVLVGGAAVLNVVLNLVLVPAHGYPGAAWATLLTFAALALAAWLCAERLMPVRYELGRVAASLALAALLFGIASLLPPDRLVLVVGAKLLLVLAFPLILWGTGYLKSEEKEKIRRGLSETFASLARRSRKSPS